MNDPRLSVPWLSSWRSYLDEADSISPRTRRLVQDAIDRQERVWTTRQEATHAERVDRNRTTRDEGVVQPYKDMTRELREIESQVSAGRMSPADARAAMRAVQARDKQLVDLHDTLAQEDEEIAAFAATTADDYQRAQVERFPVLLRTQPSLVSMMADVDSEPRGSNFHLPGDPTTGGTDPDVHAREVAATRGQAGS